MNNPTTTVPSAPPANGSKCVPCEVPGFCRNNYYTGKLLTERDLTDEQRCLFDKMRLQYMALHGWGVVCGLEVKPHKYCPQLRLVIKEGLAIDDCGREIRLLCDIEVPLPKPGPAAPKSPCPPEPEARPEHWENREQGEKREYRHREHSEPEEYGRPTHGEESEKRYEREHGEEHRDGGEREQHEDRRERREDREERRETSEHERHEERDEREDRREREERDEREEHHEREEREHREERRDWEPKPEPRSRLWVCLEYCERETEFAPAPFDECGCNGNSQKPNRICESYTIKLLDTEPPFLHNVKKHKGVSEGDCLEVYREGLRECHKPGQVPCILLAVIDGFIAGEPVTEDMIDNWTYRPVLASTHLLDRVVHCLIQNIPSKPRFTRIVEMNWTHGEECHGRDFMHRFIGDSEHPRGFEITFDDWVDLDSVTGRSFQALIVRTPGEEAEGRHLQVAPARIMRSEKGNACALHIDHAFARRHLDGSNFDLFITLRCDVLLDERGVAVDGNLLARRREDGAYVVAPPTGDGVAGGLFESWIRVRHSR